MSKYTGGRLRSRLAAGPLLALLVGSYVISGCGGTTDASSEGGATSAARGSGSELVSEKSHLPVADLIISSPAVKFDARERNVLNTSFVCKNRSFPTIRWKGEPRKTKEILVFAMNTRNIQGQIHFDGAVAGLNPKAGKLRSGSLPAGAVMGQNSEGQESFSICPRKSQEAYFLVVLASERLLKPERGFDPAILREEAYAASAHMGLLSFIALRHKH
jgi:hypothetical protein